MQLIIKICLKDSNEQKNIEKRMNIKKKQQKKKREKYLQKLSIYLLIF